MPSFLIMSLDVPFYPPISCYYSVNLLRQTVLCTKGNIVQYVSSNSGAYIGRYVLECMSYATNSSSCSTLNKISLFSGFINLRGWILSARSASFLTPPIGNLILLHDPASGYLSSTHSS